MNPVFVAIDTADLGEARALAAAVAPFAGGLKLGLEFFCHNGRDGVAALAETGIPIFVDLKFHDIPNTVASAVRTLDTIAPAVLTVHAAGGRAMMEAAKAAAPAQTKVVAVTVLTSLDRGDLDSIGVNGEPAAQVERLAALARSAGLDGIVCSGNELAIARAGWSDGFFVVPGIRPADSALGDQKRVMTPRVARDAGASILVIGRPITAAPDPVAALKAIVATL
jgi:orotidine-5'-phosphate decarboxylase